MNCTRKPPHHLTLGFVAVLICIMGCAGGSTGSEQPEPITAPTFPLPITSPGKNGFDETLLDRADLQARSLGYVRSFLVLRNGQLVHESYMAPAHIGRAQNIRSVSKSILASLVGIAINDRYFSLNSKVADFFPEQMNQVIDFRVGDITIDQLLSMRSGLPQDETSYNQIFRSEDWVDQTLNQRLVANPGETFGFSTSGSHLISVIIEKTTDQSTRAFSQTMLFQPLGVSIDHWRKDPQGHYFGGDDMFLSARELALFGQLYLQKGQWNNQSVIPQDWITKTLQPTSGGDWTYQDFNNWGYAYSWWTGTLEHYPFYTAIGKGGQYLFVMPSQQLVVVITADAHPNDQQSNLQEKQIAFLISRHLFPSLVDRYPLESE